MTSKTPLTVAYGDGIGPEIMEATLNILNAAGAQLAIETITIGEQVYKQGVSSGILPSDWDSLQRTHLLLKAPITTPQGGGVKSLNVTIRKTLGLYANIRPCVAYSPFIDTHFPQMNVVIVRENEEDLYGGIEHRQTYDVTQCLKLISYPASEKIIRFAFEYARLNQRKKVTCFTKDNIMKITDGLFHRVFNEVAKQYPDIAHEHWIIDIGTAKLATKPEQFDVIVTSNLYGDIISDVAAEVTGSVGLGASANIGDHFAMFEAIHGSAPDIAGKDLANPSGLLLAAVMMLVHINQTQTAELIHNAWLKTIEDGIHTGDIFKEGKSKQRVGTQAFAKAVIQHLGQKPQQFKPIIYQSNQLSLQDTLANKVERIDRHQVTRELVGVDVFIYWPVCGSTEALAELIQHHQTPELQLASITNRGTTVWPNGNAATYCSDHWLCRFVSNQKSLLPKHIIDLLAKLTEAEIEFIKIENLYNFDNEPGFSKGQGE